MGVIEYRVGWGTGGPNPGVSVFHARISGANTSAQAGQALADRCRTFFDAIKGLVAGTPTWTFPAETVELNVNTGQLEEVDQITAPANVVGSSSTAYSAPSGARIEWRTDAVVAGRRLRGRTFIVPLLAGAYDVQGTLSTATLTALNTAATNFRDTSVFTACQPAVWSRTHGILADITSSLTPDEAAVLRSRRD
jgi:hypothetical protein